MFPNGNANANDEEMLVVMLIVFGVIIFIALVVAIFFLLTLSKALSRCSSRNRTMEPGMVWLNLIPLFNIVWQFITVNRVSESLANEFHDRGWDRGGEDYGRSVGTTYCIMNILSIIPYCGGLFGLIGLVCFIMYWVKIAGFSSQLATGGGGDYYDDRDDYDDRRPRRRRDDDYDDRGGDDDYDRRDGGRPWDRGRG